MPDESSIASAHLLQIVKYMDVVSITILVFDYLVSLDLEISLVWGSRWSLSKIFYMLARYPPFIDVPLVLWYGLTPIAIKDCLPVYAAASWGTFFGIAMAEAILVLRTYALMGCSSRVLLVFGIQYIAILCITIAVLSLFLKSLKFGPPPIPTVVGCQIADGSIILVVAFILVLLNETIMMLCTLWVGVKRYRHSFNPLIHTLYRDGITYFILLFLISSGNLAVLIWGPLELVDLLNTFLRVMHSVLSTRCLLHIREVHRDEARTGITTQEEPKFRIPGTSMEYTIN
ncbi:hypothetical protein B0H17DRAFT_484213 [Mycena rosella]|uniref:DUF6533 domain-containing protein n=1 Tax=Mycena rosella TaxID=1033263 RepID=A0AAD7C3D7_MYCRO|nr:hypothetical protein B0H17DRAFT_484213 [Mycena rosella]